MAAKVYMEHLILTPDQKDQIEMLYNTPGQICDIQYQWNIDEDQMVAAAELAALGLDTNLREALDGQQSVHWANRGHRTSEEYYIKATLRKQKASTSRCLHPFCASFSLSSASCNRCITSDELETEVDAGTALATASVGAT